MVWSVRVLTLYPGMFPGPLGESLAGRALERGIWALETLDIRDFSAHKHRSVDDAPFGGGAGMVLRPDVVDAALAASMSAFGAAARIVHVSPRGRPLDQNRVRDLAGASPLVVLCGRFEGIDQRVLDANRVEELSVGDFVLSGGELAAMCLIDAVVRLLPGVMGNEASAAEESFGEASGGLLLEYPQYTRPAEWTGRDGVVRTVPQVLLSGHHEEIEIWRRQRALAATREKRPDLWARYEIKTNKIDR